MKSNYPVDMKRSAWSGSLSGAAALCGAVLLFAGCESEPESHVVSAPPPSTTVVAQPVVTSQTTTTTTPSGQTVVTQTQPVVVTQPLVVTQAPPAIQPEVVQASPGPDYVWVAGYWTWHDSRYEWMSGHWAMPPHSSAVWVPPHWEPENGGYRFYEGYWN